MEKTTPLEKIMLCGARFIENIQQDIITAKANDKCPLDDILSLKHNKGLYYSVRRFRGEVLYFMRHPIDKCNKMYHSQQNKIKDRLG